MVKASYMEGKPVKKIFSCAAALLLACAVGHAEEKISWTVPEAAPVGQPFLVKISGPSNFDRLSINWAGRTFGLGGTNGLYRTLLGTPLDKTSEGENMPVLLTLVRGNKTWQLRRQVKITPLSYPEERLSVAPSFVSPPQDVLQRIAQERAVVSEALKTQTVQGPLSWPFVRPVAGVVTSPFGFTRVYNGQRRSPHGGLDFRAPLGTPVHAAVDGTVILTGDHYFAGKSIYVDSGGGVISVYMHLSRIDVSAGERVKAGQAIALSGSSGRVTGPHLHLGVGLNGRWMDPAPLVGEKPLAAGVTKEYVLK